ncbi:MAG TPA: MBL fold metallo-hydrolase [Gammaproteobacteria bacterium]|nr:MBL fold metallo-hydrolase [Gammaproteobacteria bacterium]
MRLASFGSGSRGNMTLLEAGETRILVDCGFSCAEAVRRLQRLGVDPSGIDAILVTHEHSDHIAGVARFSRRFGTPVWMTAGTAAVHRNGAPAELCLFNSHLPFRVGEVEVQPFPVPHDAREPAQFVFSHRGRRLGLLTDAGSVTPHMLEALRDLDGLVLESNHDPGMLASGPYPPALRARVGGDFGHLSNAQAADLLGRIDRGRLRWLLAAHLSEKNNHPDLARAALEPVLAGSRAQLRLADQLVGSDWHPLD